MSDEKKRALDFWMYEWKEGVRWMRWKYVNDVSESCRLIPETLPAEKLAAILQEEFAGDITLDERGWVQCNCTFSYPAPTALQNSFTWRGGVIRCEGCAEKERRLDLLNNEIAKLADVLLKDFGGPTENESACEMAIRLLKEFKSASEDIQISKTSVKDMRAAGWQCATSFDEKDRLLHYIPILQREWPDQKVQYTQNDDGFRVWVRKG